jgi:prepilin peptidase CpaA
MWTAMSLALAVFAVAGALSDARTHRIPNRLVVAGLCAALLLRAVWGWTPLWHGVAGGAIALAFGLPLFLLRAFGGGDVKFLAVCGAFVGLPLVGRAALWAGVAGGVLALWVIFRRRVPLAAWVRTRELLLSALTLGRSGDRMTLDDEGALAAPYGIAIAAGTLAAWFGSAGGWIP